jgi:hypothetical protein
MPLARRLLNPAGFGLALLFFALPFVAVSCDAGQAGSIEVSYTGVDLATGATPGITATGGLSASAGGPAADAGDAPNPGVQVLAILTAVTLVAGAGTSLLQPARARLLATAGAAVAAGGLLVSTELVAMAKLRTPVGNLIEAQFPDTTAGLGGVLDDAIQTRVGFWLALAALALVLAGNIGVSVRAWVRQ